MSSTFPSITSNSTEWSSIPNHHSDQSKRLSDVSWSSSSPSLSLRRRATRILNSLPSSPVGNASSTGHLTPSLSLNKIATRSASVAVSRSQTTPGGSRATSSCSGTNQLTSRSSCYPNKCNNSTCKKQIADLEATLSVTREMLKRERKESQLISEELQALQDMCEIFRRFKSQAEEKFSKLAAALNSIVGSDMETPKQNCESDKLHLQLDYLQKVFTSSIQDIRQELKYDKAPNSGSGVLDFGVSTSISESLGLPNEALETSGLISDSTPSLTSRNLSDTGGKCAGIQVIGDEYSKENGNKRERGIKRNQRTNSNGKYSYVEGFDEHYADALRPTSVAQANRHSAIIGDHLFSLQIMEPNNVYNGLAYSALEPLTPESDGDQVSQRSATASAVSNPESSGPVKTSAPPSEDAPTMSCRVGRTFESPLGAGYVRRKFVENNPVIGRSSVAAYRRQ